MQKRNSTELSFSRLVEPLNGVLKGANVKFQTVSIDTRTLEPGELFVAIKGPHFEGHDFVNIAMERGAVGAIVSQPVETSLPCILVANTRTALAKMASIRREQLQIPVLAVTGSCGKTTAKSMISSILSHCGLVHAGQRSYNNHYGLPLTLLGVTDSYDYAVLEMGANHLGEIASLTAIARPTVAGITIAAPVHLEGFGDLAGVARGKGEIFQGLTEDGIAVINTDDGQSNYWLQLVSDKKIITFGLNPNAQVRAENITLSEESYPQFDLITPKGKIAITLPLLGEHNITNALIAAAITEVAGASLSTIKKGLETVTPVAKRLVRHLLSDGIEIIDDSYNANPLAMEAALKVLAMNEDKKIIVLGEMGELGEDASLYHAELGKKARMLGINRLYAVGMLMQHAVSAFGSGGYYFNSQEELITELEKELAEPACILVKGSRSSKMENIVEALIKEHV